MKLIAKPLLAIDKERKVTPENRDGKVYLHITRCKYIGCGNTLEDAISDANARVFMTGYLVEVI